jgi:hypothetical protein
MSSHRKDKPATTPAASDPLDSLGKLPPDERERLDEEVLRDHGISVPKPEEHVADPPVNFYESIASQAVANTRPVESELTPEDQERAMKRTLLPYTVERQAAQLKELNGTVKEQRQQIKKLLPHNTHHTCRLTQITHAMKSTGGNNSQRSTQKDIARKVDTILGNNKLELKDICPKGWLKGFKAGTFPRLFRQCLRHPILGGKAKALITTRQESGKARRAAW